MWAPKNGAIDTGVFAPWLKLKAFMRKWMYRSWWRYLRWAVSTYGMLEESLWRLCFVDFQLMIAPVTDSVVVVGIILLKALASGNARFKPLNPFCDGYRCNCSRHSFYSRHCIAIFHPCLSGWLACVCLWWCATPRKIKRKIPNYPFVAGSFKRDIRPQFLFKKTDVDS